MVKQPAIPQKRLYLTQATLRLLETYGDVTIAADIMYISKIPFMSTTSQEIHFGQQR